MPTYLVQPDQGVLGGAEPGRENVLGVVGGLGPLASAEFLRTIYQQSSWEREQQAPRVVLYSDPTFLDRTEAFLNGLEGQLLDQLVEALTSLRRIGASRLVICCITIHHLLPRVPSELTAHLVSLIDVVFDELSASGKPHLLLCTTGTRELKIFEKHNLWPQTGGLFVLPDDADQREIHQMIYGIKQSQDVLPQIPFIEALLVKYEVDSFIAGCTEIHLLAKHFATTDGGRHGHPCIDPLTSIARKLADGGFTSPAAPEHTEQTPTSLPQTLERPRARRAGER